MSRHAKPLQPLAAFRPLAAVAASQRGFTLLELLIAISILALLAVFSWRTLDAITRTSEALSLSGDRIDSVTRGFAALEHDAQSAESADLPSAGVLRLLASGGSVGYFVDHGFLMRQLPGADAGPVAQGIDGMRVDLVRIGNQAAPSQTQGNIASPLASGPANGSAAADPGAQPPSSRVAGIRVVLTLADGGGTVTRLLLLNGL